MRQTEAFSLAEQSCKLLVFFVEIKERIKIAVIVCLEVIADVARMRLLINPLADRSLTALSRDVFCIRLNTEDFPGANRSICAASSWFSFFRWVDKIRPLPRRFP